MSSNQETTTDQDLIDLARNARKKAFCPHSDYPVGAALQTGKGIYLGANVEISGRSTSVHAEMMAAYIAAMDGAECFERMAVSPEGQSGEAPCGLCQHSLAQFTQELRILEDTGTGKQPEEYELADLIGPAYSPSTRHEEYLPGQEESGWTITAEPLAMPLGSSGEVTIEIPMLIAPNGTLHARADYNREGEPQTEEWLLKDGMVAKLEDTAYDLADCRKVTVNATVDLVDLFMDYAVEGETA